MIRKMKFAPLILAFAVIFSAAALSAQDNQIVRVPEGNGKPILIDGLFSPGEWNDALKIEIRPNIHLFLKKSAGFVFLGVRYTPFTLSVVDLFISPDGKSTHHLHVSAQLGERLLNATPSLDDDPGFDWGDTTGWYANEIRWSANKAQALVKEGKNQGEAQQASLYKFDGFEFQIRQSKFESDEWLVRLETPAPPDWEKPAVFPAGADMASFRGWLKLSFK